MKLSVIIPHYNDCVRLQKCLTALAPQLTPDSEVIVVDNNSPNPPTDMQILPDRIIYTSEEKKGAAHARNKGVSLSRGEYLLFIDCDCIPNNDWLSQALKICSENSVFGGRVDVFNETPPPMNGAEAFEHAFAFNQETYIKKKKFSVTANLLVSRKIFNKVGDFKAEVSEDTEWCLRLVKHQIPLEYQAQLIVSHPTRNNWSELKRKWRRITDESYALFRDQNASNAKWVVRAFIVLLSGPAHIQKILSTNQLTKSEKVKAALTLLKLRTLRSIWMIKQSITAPMR